MNTIKVYTAITGGFEPDRSDVQVMSKYDRFLSHRMNAKIYKIMPHLFFEHEITVYMDGNIKFNPTVDVTDFVREFLGRNDMAVFGHPVRDCAYLEALACIYGNLDDADLILSQMNQYRHDGFPDHYGLAECGIIIRRNNAKVKRFNEAWWAQVCRYSSRDQISFPYVRWRSHQEAEWPEIMTHDGDLREDKRFIYKPRPSSTR